MPCDFMIVVFYEAPAVQPLRSLLWHMSLSPAGEELSVNSKVSFEDGGDCGVVVESVL